MRISPQGTRTAGEELASHDERLVKDLWYSKRIREDVTPEVEGKNCLNMIPMKGQVDDEQDE